MKILFKRNQNASTTQLPPLSAGEPLWFKDKLYIGSTGATGVSGGPSAGDAQLLVDPKSLTLSTSAQTYFQTGPYAYTLALPAADPYSTARTPTAHAFTGSEHTGISTSSLANKDLLWYDSANSTWKNGTIANILNGVSIPAGSYNNQKVSTVVTGTSHTFGDSATVAIVGDDKGVKDAYITTEAGIDFIKFIHRGPSAGGDITALGSSLSGTGENSSEAQTVDLGSPFKIPYIRYNEKGHITATGTKNVTVNHPTTYTAHSSIGGLSSTTLTVPIVSNDTQGHVSELSSASLEFLSAPTGSNKVLTEADIAGVTGAMVYKGIVDGSDNTLPTSNITAGWTYVVSVAGTYAGQACEVGDMIIAKNTKATGVTDSDWNVINGENQVTNSAATLAWGSSTNIATVDGTAITVSLPANPNTDEKVTPVSLTEGNDTYFPILSTPSSSTYTTNGKPNYINSVLLNGSGRVKATEFYTRLSGLSSGNYKSITINAADGIELFASGLSSSIGETPKIHFRRPSTDLASYIGSFDLWNDNGIFTLDGKNGPANILSTITVSPYGKITLPATQPTGGYLVVSGTASGSGGFFKSDGSIDTTSYADLAFKEVKPDNSTETGKLTTNSTSVAAASNAGALGIVAGNKWIGLAGDNTDKKITIAHQGPGSNGAMITPVATAALKKITYDAAGHITGSSDVTTSDITGLSGWTAVQDATLKVKTSTNTSASNLFSANASAAAVLFIKAGNNIGTKNSYDSSTATNTVTIDHSDGAAAGASKTSIGGVSGDTITVPIVSTDAYGHVSSLTSTEWTYTAPAAPKDGKLQLKVGTGGTATDSGFSANTNTDTPLIFNDTAAGAKFSINASKVISIIEIDGGLID